MFLQWLIMAMVCAYSGQLTKRYQLSRTSAGPIWAIQCMYDTLTHRLDYILLVHCTHDCLRARQCKIFPLPFTLYPLHFLLHFISSSLPDGTGEKVLWRANKPLPNNETQYGFTLFSMGLNEEDESEWLSTINISTALSLNKHTGNWIVMAVKCYIHVHVLWLYVVQLRST